uniref:Uncharacterized protein n=1 Tax=Meloidogyne enterolobii TaxID=390850 RepID=A0A6V7XHU3_MELEN|nr:unnamed protein product [Meloidogyne enterolobii]
MTFLDMYFINIPIMFPLIVKEGIKQILLASGGIKENVSEKLLNIFPKNE